jgi:hypothetical protein
VLEGGDTGEFDPAAAGVFLVPPPCGGGERGAVRPGRMMGTLLGPEGTTVGCLSEPWASVRLVGLPGMTWGHTGRGFAVLVFWWGCGLVVG